MKKKEEELLLVLRAIFIQEGWFIQDIIQDDSYNNQSKEIAFRWLSAAVLFSLIFQFCGLRR